MRQNTVNKKLKGNYIIKSFGMIALALLIMVSIAGAAPFAYIANYGDNSVSVVDVATNKVTATVPVGSEPLGIAVAADGSKVYVANFNSSSISVIDVTTKKVIATVPVASGSNQIAVRICNRIK